MIRFLVTAAGIVAGTGLGDEIKSGPAVARSHLQSVNVAGPTKAPKPARSDGSAMYRWPRSSPARSHRP